MSAITPKADVIGYGVGCLLLTPCRHSTDPSANGRVRPEMVIGRALAQCPLTDRKAVVGPTSVNNASVC
jgi:hypothetical protein